VENIQFHLTVILFAPGSKAVIRWFL